MPPILQIHKEDHVSRYCRPGTIEGGEVQASAFQLKPNEEYLSVNWLEYFGARNLEEAIQCVRLAFQRKGYGVSKNGRFAVLGVEEALTVVSQAHSCSLNIEHRPTDDDPSHSGIFGYHIEDIEIASELSMLLNDEDVYKAAL